MVSGLEKPEPILRGGNKELEDPLEGSDTGSIGERELSNVDYTRARGSANKHVINVLRLTTIGAARSVLLQMETMLG